VPGVSAAASAPRLRPLAIGEILDVGIKIYRANALTLFKIVVFVVLPAQIVVNIVEVSSLPSGVNESGTSIPFRPTFTTTKPVSSHDLSVFVVGFAIALLLNALAGKLAQAGCFRAVANAYLGEEAGWRPSLRFALRRLPAVIVLSIVSTFFVGIGLAFCIVPGIYLWGAFYVAVPAVLVEGAGPFRALGRSRRLVRGRWWGTIGVAVVGLLLVSVVSAALTALLVGVAFADPARNTASGFVLNTLATTLGSMLTTPAAAAFATVLYIDLRVRKEGFDLLLLAQRLGVDPPADGGAPSFLPPPPAGGGSAPPFWPPPPGWAPDPNAPARPPEPETPPADRPPYWPPPPDWKPGRT
jgi:hypothetical protein